MKSKEKRQACWEIKMVLFVYVKEGQTIVLNTKQARYEEKRLLSKGYIHTSTISAQVWIENLIELTDDEIIREVKELSKI